MPNKTKAKQESFTLSKKRSILLADALIGKENAFQDWTMCWENKNFSSSDINNALIEIEKSLQADPDSSYALCLRAYMYHKHGKHCDDDYKAAIKLYERAIALNNSDAMSLRALMCMHNQGSDSNEPDYKKTIELCEDAITLGNRIAMHTRAFLYTKLDNKKAGYKKAIELYDRAIALGYGQSMHNRAFMHEFGQGGEINFIEATKLYYNAYNTAKLPESIQALKRIYKQIQLIDAQKALILIYIKKHKLSVIRQAYDNKDSSQLCCVLYEEIIRQLNDVSHEDDTFTQWLINLAIEKDNDKNNEPLQKYILCRVHLKNNDEIEALSIYRSYLYKYAHLLSAEDCFRLGNATLLGLEGLSAQNKIERLEQSCFFYWQSIEKGDTACQGMLLNILHNIETYKQALKRSKTHKNRQNIDDANIVNANNVPKKPLDNKTCERLLNRFLKKNQTLQKKNLIKNKPDIDALSAFIVTMQYKTTRFWGIKKQVTKPDSSISIPAASDQEAISLATKIRDRLEREPLHIIMSDPWYLNRVKKHSVLFEILNNQLKNNPDNPLKLLIDEADCEQMLTKENKGELIYQALTSKKQISPGGLKILAQHKKNAIDYIKTLPNDKQAQALKVVLHNDFSLLGQFFRVQRGFLPTRLGHGTLKIIEDMQQYQEFKREGYPL